MPANGDSEPSRAFRLLVGLGNPGRKYRDTRHNIGFRILERLAEQLGASFEGDKKRRGEVAKLEDGTILLKPQTYMNLSGESVGAISKFFKIEPSETLVVYDDLDLPLGRLRFRLKGSAGGHNGIKSIIQHLKSSEFPRLKIGIGRSSREEGDAVDHVLGKFSKNEHSTLENTLKTAIEALLHARDDGLESAMTLYNRKEEKEKSEE